MLPYLQVALVQWTESVGLTLVGRDQSSMQLRTPGDQILNLTILQVFPFTYESKRMGIILRVSPALSCPLASSPTRVLVKGLITVTQTSKECVCLRRKKRALSVGTPDFNHQHVVKVALKH